MGSFSVLSWNIAEGGPSYAAPDNIDQEQNLYHILDQIEQHDPDFICLQEMPSPDFTDHLSNTHIAAQVIKTHAGYTTVFVRKGRIADQPIQLESQLTLPPLAGVSLHVGTQFLIIFSAHLPPYRENAGHRQGILSNLIKQLSSNQPLIIAGDMNMRENETSAITDLGVSDAYKQWEDPGREQYATWASTYNKFHKDVHPFEARFDRIFYKQLRLLSYQLVGKATRKKGDYYLSDHFGILSSFGFLD